MNFLSLKDEDFKKMFEQIPEYRTYQKVSTNKRELMGRGSLGQYKKENITGPDGATSEAEYAETFSDEEQQEVANARKKKQKDVAQKIKDRRAQEYRKTLSENMDGSKQGQRDEVFMNIMFNWYEQLMRAQNSAVSFENKKDLCDKAKAGIQSLMTFARERFLTGTVSESQEAPGEGEVMEDPEGGIELEDYTPMYKEALGKVKDDIAELVQCLSELGNACTDENEKILYTSIGKVLTGINTNIDTAAEQAYNNKEVLRWSSVLERSQGVRSEEQAPATASMPAKVMSFLGTASLYAVPKPAEQPTTEQTTEQPVTGQPDTAPVTTQKQEEQPTTQEDVVTATGEEMKYDILKDLGRKLSDSDTTRSHTGFKVTDIFMRDITNIAVTDSLMGYSDRDISTLKYSYEVKKDKDQNEIITLTGVKAVYEESDSRGGDTQTEQMDVIRKKGDKYGFTLSFMDQATMERIGKSTVDGIRGELSGEFKADMMDKFVARFVLLKLSLFGPDGFAEESEKMQGYLELVRKFYPDAVKIENRKYVPNVSKIGDSLQHDVKEWEPDSDVEQDVEAVQAQDLLQRFVYAFRRDTELEYKKAT